jgi:5-methylcytosine-specific restriction endonuclease McrA
MSAIPTKARAVVGERDAGHCLRCGGHSREIHHRRRRREGGHDYEVLVSLCSECHRWAHAEPTAALEAGFRVSAFNEDVAGVPIRSFMGPIYLEHDGGIRWG